MNQNTTALQKRCAELEAENKELKDALWNLVNCLDRVKSSDVEINRLTVEAEKVLEKSK